MKSSLFLLLSLVALSRCAVDNNDIVDDSEGDLSETTAYSELEEALKRKCELHGGDGAFEDVELAIKGIGLCLKPNVHRPHSGDLYDLVCTNVRQQSHDCFKSLGEKVGKCLTDDESFLPEFIVRAHNNSFDYDCRNDHQNLKTAFQSLLSGMCKLSSFDLNEMFADCMKDFNIVKKRNNKPELTVTKADICHDLGVAKRCAAAHVQSRCPYSVGLSDHTLGVYNSYIEQCTEEEKKGVSS